MLPQKRPHPDSKSKPPPLPEAEQKIYTSIKSKQSMGIWTADIKRETGLPNTVVTKALKSLQNKNLIKDVVNVHNRAKKMFMAVEFEPSREISGGSWYTDGKLDTELINALKRVCLRYIAEHKVTTMEEISRSIEASRVLNVPCSMQQLLEIVRTLVLDKEIEEFRSKGAGEFARVPSGKTCYRISRGKVGTEAGYLASVPCGVCPRISECTPDGVISPKTCVYYNKWLNLDF
ncbi:probable DNA-directed RNA polymerase III subunit RPC6 [Zingiber officinale]|nr:probable DNA-directed RNA polymerase III subunit RPC6 [Zingiber officinale]XP_042426867.1 probable DNA-directed RNA polymerase III subunit RPC6 [Zingiber officinale]XP_042426868.1 probable DNA-directed RNA polymerase III subunit RPC6 [Zingiber officinale]XP_042469764.1 probable DNA-directed RNA polymerase III subunit RPC6 [Zingiber officinale]KAG6482082.1 hypothetical protein ZIOFF_058709 [Zingiber officinale]KAG6521766.1 hypothetical protein ZIOFF_018892 [Zingiber officinale]